MEIFTPEQEEKIKLMLAAQRKEIDAQYTVKAHQLRAWIEARPLPASRVALALGIAFGAGGMWLFEMVWRWI
jgi:hypothetical protein